MKYNNGTTQWEYGQKILSNPDDWHKLLGPCPKCGSPCFDYGGGWRCNSAYCKNSVNNPVGNLGAAPKWWDTGINVMKDGNKWCAHDESFTNLQESHSGWGDNPKEAVDDYFKKQPA